MMNQMNAQAILELAQNFMECRILQTAAELNIFTVLAEKPRSAREVADKIGGDARATAFLLDAVAAIGLLKKHDRTYLCENSISHLLSADSPDTILPMVLHMSHLYSRWSHLPEIVKGGTSTREEFDFSRNGQELRAFIGAMHSIGAPLARQIVASVGPEASRNLLDIGGGSGTYTIAFLRAVPEMRATIFDLPEVIEMARERLKKEGLLDRTTLVLGSFYEDELPQGHDLVLISAIIHSNSLEENLDLYKKAFRALNSGGRILIRDHVMEPDRVQPKDGAVFAVNMLVGTSGGGCYTYEEIEAGFLQAGFTQMRLLRKGEHMDAVVEAFKP
jgi:phospholipid N-methyltransferase